MDLGGELNYEYMKNGKHITNHLWVGDAVLFSILLGFVIGLIATAILFGGYSDNPNQKSFGTCMNETLEVGIIALVVWGCITFLYICIEYYMISTRVPYSLLLLAIYAIILAVIGLVILVITVAILATPVYCVRNYSIWKATRANRKAKQQTHLGCLETKIKSLQEDVIQLRGKTEDQRPTNYD